MKSKVYDAELNQKLKELTDENERLKKIIEVNQMQALIEKTEKLKIQVKFDELVALQNSDEYIVKLISEKIKSEQSLTLNLFSEPTYYISK